MQPLPDEALEPRDHQSTHAQDPALAVELKERAERDRERVDSALDQLREDYRAVVRLFYFMELTYPEIADVLGVPENTVAGWLNRAKKQLRKGLGPDEHEKR